MENKKTPHKEELTIAVLFFEVEDNGICNLHCIFFAVRFTWESFRTSTYNNTIASNDSPTPISSYIFVERKHDIEF